MAVHAGELTTCRQCDRIFPRLDKLAKHMREEHGDGRGGKKATPERGDPGRSMVVEEARTQDKGVQTDISYSDQMLWGM